MGRGKRSIGTRGDRGVLSEREQQVLSKLPRDGGSADYVHIEGLSSRQVRATLEKLEVRGLVERYPNGHGPEKPWWWTPLPAPPEGFDPSAVSVSKGDVYDRAPGPESMVFIELTGQVNEHGCAVASLKAGDNNARRVFVPLHLLDYTGFWYKRRRGPVTDYSRQFSCPTHGECTDEMVTTKKTCAFCGQGLIRH